MRRRVIARGNVRKSDYDRIVLSDTMPGDVPIIVSNDGFYRNIKRLGTVHPAADDVLEGILAGRRYTVPYRYNIIHKSNGARRLSLIHPHAQRDVVNFYKKYDSLIRAYAARSPFSIRSPTRVATMHFVRGRDSERAAYKGAAIETSDLSERLAHPASYFRYDGVNRAYKFFNSPDFLRLEKRYNVMYLSDVSKCFESIYTHTLAWAINNQTVAKDFTHAKTFANEFDRLMQAMNFNETNGICIGAEVSRVFAELLLSEVDRRVRLRLRDRARLHFRTNYEVRRYVDDYYVFADTAENAQVVLDAIEAELSAFNMHLSQSKTELVPRPFITSKARMIREASLAVQAFLDRFIITEMTATGEVLLPRRIGRSDRLIRSFVDEVKASCFDQKTGYDSVANYVIAALVDRINVLIADYQAVKRAKPDTRDDAYVTSLLVLLEAAYFFYHVTPSVPSSHRIARGAILTWNFVEERIPDRKTFVAEQIVRFTFQFMLSARGLRIHDQRDCIPLEALNVMLVVGQVANANVLAQKAVSEFCGSRAKMGYFEIVSFLYCMKDQPDMAPLKAAIVADALGQVRRNAHRLAQDSEMAHLSLDVLACPFVSVAERVSLLADIRVGMQLAVAPVAQLEAAVAAIESQPWFVNWNNTDLLRILRKKELSEVY